MHTDIEILVQLVAARSERMRHSARPWTAEEDQFIRENLGHSTEEEMARYLGRSRVAVMLRWKRDLHLPSPSKAPDALTANQAAKLLGIDGHKTAGWVDAGLLPGRLMAGGRNIRLIKRQDFRRWVLNPRNWVYFNPSQVKDPELKLLLKKRAARWGDQWWTTRQVADHHGVPVKNVEMQIRRGQLKSFHLPVSLGGRNWNRAWSNHFILRSQALQAVFLRGKGHGQKCRVFTPAADAWILKARDELGMTFTEIGRTMKIGRRDYPGRTNPIIAYRYRKLKETQARKKRLKR